MIEIDGKIYRNLEEQVRKNKEDIESIDINVTSNTNAITNISNRLDNLDLTYATDEDIQDLQSQINTKANQSDLNSTNSRVSTLESTVTQLSPQVAKSLKTPMSAPSSTELVAIDTSNGQAMISIGAGLVIENDTLKSTGGVQIIDNLTSTSISAALSANQGRVLSNTISTLTSSVDGNTDQIEFLQADIAGKTNVTINNVHQDYINFTSDPQTQINAKANQSALDSTNANVTSLTNNKANKDLSNVTYPQLTPDGTVHTSSGYTTYMTTDGNTWYMKFPNGFKICGGYRVSTSSTQQIVQVNFESNFFQSIPTVIKQAGYSGYYTNPVSWDYLQVWDVTTSSFKTPTYNASNGGNFKWVAFGR